MFFNDLGGRVYALNLQAEGSSKHIRQQDPLGFKRDNTLGESGWKKKCSLLRTEAKSHTTPCGSKGDTVNHNVTMNQEHQAAKIHTHK